MSCTPGIDDVTISGRSVQWAVVLGPHQLFKKSNRFMMGDFVLGDWPWELAVLRLHASTCVRLTSPAPPNSPVERVASVSVSVVNFTQDPPTKKTQRVEMELDRAGSNHGFLWGEVGVAGAARLEIEIKFINFKIRRNNGPLLTSFQIDCQRTTDCRTAAQSGLSRMLSEGILTDIVVNAVGGSIGAHRAVLAARSPVFEKMFSHDLREKTESTLDIPDMSAGACRAFVGYLYGDLCGEDLLAHRGELLHAGDKYDVPELKWECEGSMMNDVNVENAFERLRTAHLYGLPALKRCCLRLLRDFRRTCEAQEGFREFMRTADPDLVAEVNENLQANN